ncbi:MAG: hypothetical protein EBU66_16275 [Bacteroidetes bacterium]|nr:hypothetical protein [Bacteroidota bacterium]
MLLKRPILAVVETGVLGLLAGVVLGLLGGVLMVRGLGVLLRLKAGFSVLALWPVLRRKLLFAFVRILLVFLASLDLPLLPRAPANGFNTLVLILNYAEVKKLNSSGNLGIS